MLAKAVVLFIMTYKNWNVLQMPGELSLSINSTTECLSNIFVAKKDKVKPLYSIFSMLAIGLEVSLH